MKNDLNFAQKSTALLNDQCRPVRVIQGSHQSARSVRELEFQRNRAFAVTNLTSNRSFRSFLSFLSFDFGLIRY
ncbi:MAG TPA: hypothetical protein PKZ53_22130, partial [Acidobacteriota bacterium]|nr:hypothetical protein [Acidobacteriota bacterium]